MKSESDRLFFVDGFSFCRNVNLPTLPTCPFSWIVDPCHLWIHYACIQPQTLKLTAQVDRDVQPQFNNVNISCFYSLFCYSSIVVRRLLSLKITYHEWPSQLHIIWSCTRSFGHEREWSSANSGTVAQSCTGSNSQRVSLLPWHILSWRCNKR